MDKRKLRDELTEMFIWYQHRLENPMPVKDESRGSLILRYQSERMFHAKVERIVASIMQKLDEHIDWRLLEEDDEQIRRYK